MKPPRKAIAFLRWFCREDYLEEIEGDLTEVFEKESINFPRIARWKFSWRVMKYFRPQFLKPFRSNQPNLHGLYKNYWKVSLRSLWKNKGLSIINITGLVIAMSCSTVILLFVENEFSFDRFHHDSNNIFRVVKDFVNDDGTPVPDATTPPALAKAIRDELPEIESATRLFPNKGRLYLLQYGEKRFYETSLIRIDSNFFKVFDFPFISGSKNSAFKNIHSIMLSETTAKKYFGDEDPMDKVIRVNLNNGTDFVVAGIFKDVPKNSHFTFDILIPFESRRDPDVDWDRNGFYTYARLKAGSNPTVFESNVRAIFKRNRPNSSDYYYIQPLQYIHLNSRLKWELSENGDAWNVKIMIAIGWFVILIASINYVNLVTAQASKRAREVGVRKVAGASKSMLVWQFLAESILTAGLSIVFSFLLTLLLLPLSRLLFGYDLSILFYQSEYLRLIPCFGIAIGALAGIYPAFYLSGFDPLKNLKGNVLSSFEGVRLRESLVVFQFVISSCLIIGTLTIVQQLNFLKQKELGFSKDNVLLLPNVRGGIGSNVINPLPMTEELKTIPGIKHIARADGVLGDNNSVNGISKKNNENHIVLNFIRVDYEFLPTLQINVKSGRNFSELFISDSTAIILNETAIHQLGLSEPCIGQQLAWDDEEGKKHDVTLIGIVKDFHFNSFREVIKPFGFILEVGNGSTFFLKTESQSIDKSIEAVHKVWTKYYPEIPFQFSFQDEGFAKNHASEARFQNLFSVFTGLAILITCLGIFGLLAYLTESKTKEIGIRKVLGASVTAILFLLSKGFLRIVIISYAISFPIAYYLMNGWLQNFAYRSTIGWKVFGLTIVVSIAFVLITLSYQAIKAALLNPVKSLRTE